MQIQLLFFVQHDFVCFCLLISNKKHVDFFYIYMSRLKNLPIDILSFLCSSVIIMHIHYLSINLHTIACLFVFSIAFKNCSCMSQRCLVTGNSMLTFIVLLHSNISRTFNLIQSIVPFCSQTFNMTQATVPFCRH